MERNEGDCSNCPSRWFCNELCDAAEWYVNKDYVRRIELLVDVLPPRKPFPHVENPTHLTPIELEILRFFDLGYTVRRISETLGITTNSVYVHKHNMKKKHIKI